MIISRASNAAVITRYLNQTIAMLDHPRSVGGYALGAVKGREVTRPTVNALYRAPKRPSPALFSQGLDVVLEIVVGIILSPFTMMGCESSYSGGYAFTCKEPYHESTCEHSNSHTDEITEYSCCKDDHGCVEGTHLSECSSSSEHSDEVKTYSCCIADDNGSDGDKYYPDY